MQVPNTGANLVLNVFGGSYICCWPCLPSQVKKDIVFRFNIEYCSLRDFGPLGNK
jgi:hypothetical protein